MSPGHLKVGDKVLVRPVDIVDEEVFYEYTFLTTFWKGVVLEVWDDGIVVVAPASQLESEDFMFEFYEEKLIKLEGLAGVLYD